MTSRSVRLGGYPAKKCPRVTHNDHSPTSPPKPEVSADLQQRFDDGIDFEVVATEHLLAAHPGAVFIDEEALGWDGGIEATLAAMSSGASLIVNGRLPDVGGRVGAPDVLVRVQGGYLPVDIKHHKTFGTQKRAVLAWSSLASPQVRGIDPDRSGDGPHRSDDTMQLAHYTRMLEGLGVHPGGTPWGGIVGTSDFTDVTGERYGVTWYDLSAPHETTYSASEPKRRKKRSPLDRYDHEFAFRVAVAEAALAGGELVRPVGTKECWDCVWREHCVSVAGPSDASFAFSAGELDAREWLFLAQHGGDTIEGLAALDAAALADEFALQAVGKQRPVERLLRAVDRARMIRDDIDLEPFGGVWPEVPTADLEIDFDIEWGTDQLVYQWGVRVRQGQDESSASYSPNISFDPLDAAGEAALAEQCASQLEELVAAASGSVTIFHWTGVEAWRSRKHPRMQALLDEHGFDLYAWVKEHLRVRGSYSIKDVAPLFGFAWGVDDAGGFASMAKIVAARAGDVSARQWCLEYNESDVAAQAAIRDGLAARRSGASDS